MAKIPLTYEALCARLQILMGDEKPYAWAIRHGIKDTFSNLNRLKHIPRPHTLQTLAKNVGCDYNWLITGEGEPFPPKQPSSTPDKFDKFYQRLQFLIGDERPYSWASRLGLKNTLGSIDRYKHIPTLNTIRKIADKANCDAQWLSTGEGEPFPQKQPDNAEKAVAQEPPPQQPAKVVGQIVGGHTRINVEVLQMVQDTLDEFLDGNGLTLETGKRSALIALLYDYVIGIQGTETDAKRMLNTINMIK